VPEIRVGPNEPFTGAGPLRSAPGDGGQGAEKPFVSVRVGDHIVDAILDTGGVWLVLSPSEAELAGVVGWAPVTHERLTIRGDPFIGRTYRVPVELGAIEGRSVHVEITVFVPACPEDQWALPNFLGWQGCLNRFRFALDAEAERFYFGVIGAG
jgi:hypothetical protein